jgi:hypothetical protein
VNGQNDQRHCNARDGLDNSKVVETSKIEQTKTKRNRLQRKYRGKQSIT